MEGRVAMDKGDRRTYPSTIDCNQSTMARAEERWPSVASTSGTSGTAQGCPQRMVYTGFRVNVHGDRAKLT